MSMIMRRWSGVFAVVALSGCADKYEMVTAALMTDPETTGVSDSASGTGTGTTDASPTSTAPTSGDPSSDPSGDPSSDPTGDPTSDPTADPTEPTTGAPVTCDTPEACTAEGEGDISPLALPFFRGQVCVSDNVKPGDKIAMSFSTCAHPCLDVGGFKYKWTTRNSGDGFEVAVVFYHPGTAGTACPPDVFGEFPAEACVYGGPIAVSVGPLNAGDTAWEGPASLVVPFFTNEEAASYDAGMDDGATVWANVGMHMQASDRTFALTLDAGNEAAPGECGEGVAGCTCRAIGL
ncbi:MAG: hypothetical protein JNL82_21280 [Myxococcales bacterium]|nr:hypothetical protein [Myxococcales bacterium]